MISFLYSSVGIIIAVAYLPQLYKLLWAQSRCIDISLMSWMLWNYAGIISLLYGAIELNDFKMTMVNSVNVSFINLIIVTTIYKRRKYASNNVQDT